MPSGTLPLAARLNKLEQSIVSGEGQAQRLLDSIEDAKWAQAEEVVRLSDAGHTQREIAGEWVNLRTGKPYSQNHVKMVAQAWRRFENLGFQDRPSWADAYATVKAGSQEVVTTTEVQREVHESRVPTSEATAEKFVQKLATASPEVLNTIAHGARELQENQYYTPVERKARKAEADGTVQPIREAIIGEFGKLEAVQALEDATDALRDMVRARAINGERLGLIMRAHDAFYEELGVAAAMIGVEV